jgi:outer membrane protein OmpA-like peptidoglycan-associated protein
MKKIFAAILALTSVVGISQTTPSIEVGGGMALKHTEDFYIPRLTVAGANLFKGLGIYATYEQRNEVNFIDDFNGDGNYQRYTVGPMLTLNSSLYAFAGLSPVGPYGLGHSFGKVRKEIGLGLVFNPITLRLGYSNWVGTTIGVAYRFGAPKESSPKRVIPVSRRTAKPSEAPRVDTVRIVETVVIKEEVIKEIIKEVEKPLELTHIATLYFQFNQTNYTAESQALLAEVVATIQANPDQTIVIIGHTDEVGTDAYNYTLGLNRAQALANALVIKHGVHASQIEVRSEGKESPANAVNADKNRRVEVYFKK